MSVLHLQLPGRPGGHDLSGSEPEPYGPGHPVLHRHLLRLCGGGTGLPDPVCQQLSAPAAEAGAGHLPASGPQPGAGVPAAVSGDRAHRPGLPGPGPGAGPAGLPGAVRPHPVHVLPAGGRLRPGLLPPGCGADGGVLRPYLPAGDGVQRPPGLPGQAAGPDAERPEKRGAAPASPVGVGGPVRRGGGLPAHRLRHSADLRHGLRDHSPHAVHPHAGPGHPGDPAGV